MTNIATTHTKRQTKLELLGQGQRQRAGQLLRHRSAASWGPRGGCGAEKHGSGGAQPDLDAVVTAATVHPVVSLSAPSPPSSATSSRKSSSPASSWKPR